MGRRRFGRRLRNGRFGRWGRGRWLALDATVEPKVAKQLEKRGSSKESVDDTIQNPDDRLHTRHSVAAGWYAT